MSTSSLKKKNDPSRPTKKEVSKRREANRISRKKASDERKSKQDKSERKNPVSVTRTDNGLFVFHGRSTQPTIDKNSALAPFNKVIWDHGEQLLLLPTKDQQTMINKTIGCARNVRNDYLDTRIKLFTQERKTMTGNDYKSGRLKELKQNERPWLCEVDKFALESAIEHVDDAYRNFFEGRAMFPKFASRYKPNGNHYTTKYTNDNIRLSFDDAGDIYLQLPKIGKVRAVLPEKKDTGHHTPEECKDPECDCRSPGQGLYSILVYRIHHR